MKIVIASDSFKGSLTSEEVAEAASEGIHAVFPDCTVCRVCVADGGEGTADAILKATGGRTVSVKVHDPLMRPVTAAYAITADGGTAIIETAAASGLPLLSETERNPMKTSTFGMPVQGCSLPSDSGSRTRKGGSSTGRERVWKP